VNSRHAHIFNVVARAPIRSQFSDATRLNMMPARQWRQDKNERRDRGTRTFVPPSGNHQSATHGGIYNVFYQFERRTYNVIGGQPCFRHRQRQLPKLLLTRPTNDNERALECVARFLTVGAEGLEPPTC
jgi:hypothetical protein